MVEDRLRVLAVTNLWPERAGFRGIFIEEQVEALRALGHTIDVEVVAQRRGKPDYLLAARRVRGRAGGYDVVHFHYGLTSLAAPYTERLRSTMSDPRGHVIAMGVDLELFQPMNRHAARAALGIDPDEPVDVRQTLAGVTPSAVVEFGQDLVDTLAKHCALILRSGARSNGRDTASRFDWRTTAQHIAGVYGRLVCPITSVLRR